MSDSLDNKKTKPRFALGLAIAACFTLLSGIAHGYLDGRWASNVDHYDHGSKVDQLAKSFGSWTLASEGDLKENVADVLRCYGSTVREYVNSETGDRVNVAVLFGPRGPTAIHIPEICFNSIGTNQVGERSLESIDLDGKRHTFWSVKFARGDETLPSIDVWYAWSDGSEWVAGKYPRFWMTETLYKVQVSGPAGDSHATVACRDFLTAFAPHLEQLKQLD